MEEKPRLTDQQKKKNHIISEKKRREAIRAGFEELAAVVPGCEGQARSEALVLQRSVIYTTKVTKKKDKLKEMWIKSGRSLAEFDQVYVDTDGDVRARKAAAADNTSNDDQEAASQATRATPGKATRAPEGKAMRAPEGKGSRAPEGKASRATEGNAQRAPPPAPAPQAQASSANTGGNAPLSENPFDNLFTTGYGGNNEDY